jgi:hypothetical protein
MSEIDKNLDTSVNENQSILSLPLSIAGKSFLLSKAVEQVKEFESSEKMMSPTKKTKVKQRIFRNDTSSGKLKPSTWNNLIKEALDGQTSVASYEYKIFDPNQCNKAGFVLEASQRHKANRSILLKILTDLELINWKGWDNPFNVAITPELFPPDYFIIIKKPISLVDIRHKYETDETYSLEQFDHDVCLMLKNALKFNREGEAVYGMARDLRARFEVMICEHVGRAPKTESSESSSQSQQKLKLKRGRTPPPE